MLDVQQTSSLIWRFEAARLADNTIIGSSSLFSVGELICKNVKLSGISQEKVAACKVGRYLGATHLYKRQKRAAAS